MTKPDDLSQEDWDMARYVLDSYLYSKLSPDEAIARAIKAARLQEREAVRIKVGEVIESISNALMDGWDVDQDDLRAWIGDLSVAIRARK